jgi:hypothetical protein
MKNSDEPAMPGKVTLDRTTYEFKPFQFGNDDFECAGLTKREHFAGLAMQGFISAGSQGMPTDLDVAVMAIKYADALLKALEQNK